MKIRRILAVLLLTGLLLSVLTGCGCSVRPAETPSPEAGGTEEVTPDITDGTTGGTEAAGDNTQQAPTEEEPAGTTQTTESDTDPVTEASTEPSTSEPEPTSSQTEATEPATEETTEPSAPETEPTTPATEPTTPATEPSIPETEPSNPATEPSDSSGCAHTWTDWAYEEYTYKQQGVPPDTQWYDRVSHRLARSCIKCGQKETGNTPDHPCQKGSKYHTISQRTEATCTVGATMRSTCNICGWYVEYEGKKAGHVWTDETIHISDYTEYTNELDAIISECTNCGLQSIWYEKGEGFTTIRVSPDYSISMKPVDKFEYSVTSDDFRLLEHPQWQTVYRNLVYNAEGYVIQFDYIYCTSSGTRYVCTVNTSDVAGQFAETGQAPPLEEYEGMNYRLTYYFGVTNNYVYLAGWHIGWSG